MGLLQIVKSYFTAIGVNMDIKTLDNASWNAFVSTNYKQDALAALSTGGVMGKTNEPILQLQKFLSGSNNQYLRVNDPHYDTFYPSALAATSVDAVKKIVSDCNLYIAQQHFTVSLLQPMTFSLVQPWFKGYNGEYGATYGNWGPSILGFYTSRFWIDQPLKKSLGH
jgi:ABC-type transport system substrate-binding protein